MTDIDDSSASGKLLKARDALALGDITTADILSREIVEKDAASEQELILRRDVLLRIKDFTGAIEIVARLIKLCGESKELFFQGAYYAELDGNYELALKGYEKALQLEPADVLSLLGMGRCMLNSVGVSGADLLFARAYELEPDNQEAAEYLGLAYEKEANFLKGIPFCEEAVKKFPRSWMLLVVLGNLWSDSGKSAKGLIYISRAIEMKVDHQKPLVSAASLLNKLRRPFEALNFIEKAKKIAPGDLNILLEESALLRSVGRSAEALKVLEKVFRYVPDIAVARSNYLFFMHDINGISRDKIFSESVRYDQDICAGIAPLVKEFGNDRKTGRPLNVGFLSSDFREHSVAYFLLPLLEAFDKNRYKLFLFSSNVRDDGYTEKFREVAEDFISVRDMTDYAVAEIINKKQIDVLFELGGHTAKNRLNVCAYRPAPVQVNWLGYPDTTGLKSVEYRIVDSITDPVGDADKFAAEKLLRMEHGFLCYQPPENAPEVSELPYMQNSFITFGSFCNMAKINPDMIALWSRLLLDNPGSRLLLKNKALGEDSGKKDISQRFQAHGIELERLTLIGSTETTSEHLELYSKVDIALDTFPYNGTTTTYEALYMGVPVVGLCGLIHSSRVGESILSRAGLGQLVAQTPQQYLRIASALASQIDDLKNLRTGMRQRLLESGLLDKRRFAEEFSALIDEMWLEWVRNCKND